MPKSGEITEGWNQTPVGDGGSQPLPAGTAVDRYVIVQALAEGGMGVVYIAHDPELDRRVALKLLRAEMLHGEGSTMGRNRLVREAHAMAKLNHPNVTAIYDAGIYGDQVFLAVELVEGMDVGVWLDEPRPWREVVEVFLKAGRGLAAAHAAGLVHRDFKPDNILLGKAGEVKVADFGLARAAGLVEAPPEASPSPEKRGAGVSGSLRNRITQVGIVTGTPGYIAPEQLIGRPSDARGDQFSFCVALYEALYGERPFVSSPLAGKPVSEAPKGSQVPAWVRKVLLRGLSINPADRYPALTDLLDALADDPAVRRRRALLGTGVAALFVAAIATTALIFIRQRAAADACHDPAGRLAGVWDTDVRRAAHDAFVATGDPKAETTFAYAERAMARAMTSWLTAYAGACADTRERHVEPEAALQLRLECLDEQKLDLRAAVDLMLHPEAGKLSASIGAASALPLPLECADARALSVVERPTEALRPQVDALRRQLARARAELGAANYESARALLKQVIEGSQGLGADSLESEALLELGMLGLSPGQTREPPEDALKAFRLAEAAHRDQLAASAAALVVKEEAIVGRPRVVIDASIERAKDALLRVGPGGAAELAFAGAMRYVALYRGEVDEAVKYGRRALDLSEQLYGNERPETLAALDSLAASLDDLGKYQDELALYQRAVAGADALLGPTNAQAALPQKNIAEMQIDLGQISDAAETMKALWLRFPTETPGTGDELMTEILASQGRILVAQGSIPAGLASIAKALAMSRELRIAATPDCLETNQYAAEAYLLAGQPQAAITIFEKNIAGLDIEARSPRWVTYLRLAGWAYLDAGQPQKAVVTLQRALDLSAGHPFYPGWVARLRYQLARALLETGGDPVRARTLADEAHDELVAEPVKQPLLAEVDAWRVKSFLLR